MVKERLSTVDSNFCDQILKYGNIKEDYSFRLGSENKRHYVIEYEGDTYYLTKTDGFWTYIYLEDWKKMRIRIPNFIGRKLYFKCRKWEIQMQFTIRPMIRMEHEFYTYIKWKRETMVKYHIYWY